MRRVSIGLIILLICGVLAMYNSCEAVRYTSLKNTSTAGNPMVSNQLSFAVCGVINACNPSVSMNTCLAGLLTTSGFSTPLGLPASYTTLSTIVTAEQSGSITGNIVAAGSCNSNISVLSCSDPVVVGAYNSSSATPFAGAPNMVNATYCNQDFAPQLVPKVVQNAQNFAPSTNLSMSLSMMPTGAGNLLVAGMTADLPVQMTSVVDNASGGSNTWVNTPYGCVNNLNANNAWIWYAKNSSPGATSLTVSWTGTNQHVNVWFVEVSGMDTLNPLDTGAVANSQPANPVGSAPPVSISFNHDVVFSLIATAAVSSLTSGSAFTGFPTLNGDDLAYFISSTTGSYGAQWNQINQSYCATTAAFKAAQ